MKLSSSLIPSIDSTVEIPVEKDESVERAIAQCVENPPVVSKMSDIKDIYDHYVLLTVPVLTPIQIDLVFQRLLRIPYYHSDNLSLYISALIQKSYHAGNNGFMLHTQNILLDDLCAEIKGGNKKRRVAMTIYGDTGDATGWYSGWCSIRHEGNAGKWYFHSAIDAKVFISGTIGKYFLGGANKLLFRTTNKKTFKRVKRLLSRYEHELYTRVELVDSSDAILDRYPKPERALK